MTVILPSLDFSIVSDNDDMIQINITKTSDGEYAAVASARWQMFFPGTRTPAVTKENDDIIIVPTGIKFLLSHEDTVALSCGLYKHEATVITTDGRIHTVTQDDTKLSPGVVTLRDILTDPPA